MLCSILNVAASSTATGGLNPKGPDCFVTVDNTTQRPSVGSRAKLGVSFPLQAVHDSLLRTLKETAERLGQNRSLLLIGPHGCGKTLVRPLDQFDSAVSAQLRCISCPLSMCQLEYLLPKPACCALLMYR